MACPARERPPRERHPADGDIVSAADSEHGICAMNGDRPSFLQYLGYCYGKVLPKSMNKWIIQDLGGRGASLRMTVRFIIPCFVGLSLLWLIPSSVGTKVGATLPIFVPFVYFSVALNRVYRRYRLSKHGLDPDLADTWVHERDFEEHDEYERRFGR